eukprot:scaffold12357_cov48-Isochrysis_galbana.AAC.1
MCSFFADLPAPSAQPPQPRAPELGFVKLDGAHDQTVGIPVVARHAVAWARDHLEELGQRVDEVGDLHVGGSHRAFSQGLNRVGVRCGHRGVAVVWARRGQAMGGGGGVQHWVPDQRKVAACAHVVGLGAVA